MDKCGYNDYPDVGDEVTSAYYPFFTFIYCSLFNMNFLPKSVPLFFYLFLLACSGEKQKANSSFDSISLSVTPKPPINPKQKLLDSLKGDYYLESISGSLGANTMIDFWKENGRWSSNESSIVDGQRDGYLVELPAEKAMALDALKITVADDLTLVISCITGEIQKIPFNPDGLLWSVSSPWSEFQSTVPKEVNAQTTFADDKLYLFVSSLYSDEKFSCLNGDGFMVDSVVLYYDLKDKKFVIQLFDSNCCSSVQYIF